MKRRQKKQVQLLKNILICGISSFLIFTTVMTVYRTFSLSQNVDTKSEELHALQSEKDALQQSVKNLQNNDYVTRYARDNYAYTREGEEVVKIPEKPIKQLYPIEGEDSQ